MPYLEEILTDVGYTAAVHDHSAPSKHTIQVVITAAVLPTAVTIDFEGSINDGADFVVLASHDFDAVEIASGVAVFHVVYRGVDACRVRVKTLTGATDPSIAICARDTL